MSTGSENCLPVNPDVSGIGVRSAIYAQNLLSFIPAFYVLADGKVEGHELQSIETQATTILITALALLISTIVEALTGQLSYFHAAIILNLSWMNNTNLFIYFFIYVHRRAWDPGRGDNVPLDWQFWGSTARELFRQRKIEETAAKDDRTSQAEKGYTTRKITSIGYLSPTRIGIEPRRTETFKKELEEIGDKRKGSRYGPPGILPRKFTLLLGTFHLSPMAAVGVWFWIDPLSFGTLPVIPCPESPIIFVMGGKVPLSSRALRIFSLMIYSVVLLPVFNFIFPMVLAIYSLDNFSSKLYRVRPTLVCLSILAGINVIFVVDTELTLRWNRSLQGPEEATWTFGQTLAVLLLLVPLRDIVEGFTRSRTNSSHAWLSVKMEATDDRIEYLLHTTRRDAWDDFELHVTASAAIKERDGIPLVLQANSYEEGKMVVYRFRRKPNVDLEDIWKWSQGAARF